MLKNLMIRNVIYMNIEKSKTREELIENCLKALKEEKLITSEIINDSIVRRMFDEKGSIDLLKKFSEGKLLDGDKKKAKGEVIGTIIEVVSFYNAINNGEHNEKKNVEETMEILKNNFEYGELDIEKVRNYQRMRNLKEQSLRTISRNFKDLRPYKKILEIYGADFEKSKDEEGIGVKVENSFEDDLFDILSGENDIEDNLVSVKKEKGSVEKVIQKQEKREKIDFNSEIKKNEKKEKKEKKVTKVVKEEKSDLDKSFKIVAKELGYHVVKAEKQSNHDEKIEILKELASLKKGAVLSELYNIYTSLDSQSKDNIEAAIGNFFNKLKVLGFEADEENEVGDDIIVNTKDALDKFVFSSPVSEKGEVIGIVKHRAWNYKGKKITPMVVDIIED